MPRFGHDSWLNYPINLSLCIISVLVSLILCDWVFIKYEKAFLLSSSTDIRASKNNTFDLASLGFKEKTVSADKNLNTIRILNIGDSFAYAAVAAPYTYSDVLEKLLNQIGDGLDFEVVNLGVPGISFPEYLAQFNFWSSKLDYDGVIFNFYTGNDFLDMEWLPYSKDEETRFKNGEFFVGKGSWVPRLYQFRFLDYAKAYYSMYMPVLQKFLLSDSQTMHKAIMFPWMDTFIVGKNIQPPVFYIKAMRRASFAYRISTIDKVRNGYSWFLALIDLAQKAIDSGKFVLMVSSPSNLAFSRKIQKLIAELEEIPEDSLDPKLPGAVLASLAEMRQYKGNIIDLFDCLASYANKELYFSNFSDTHWTKDGNEIVGKILADQILNDWLQIKRNKNFSNCSDAKLLSKKKMMSADIALPIYQAWLREQH